MRIYDLDMSLLCTDVKLLQQCAWCCESHASKPGKAQCRMEGGDSEGSETDQEEDDEDAAPHKRQVFFCSRTHSQLSQFVSELRRTPFAETLSVAAMAGRKVTMAVSTQIPMTSLKAILTRNNFDTLITPC